MENIRIAVDASITVSGLLLAPADSETCFILAHGAGAGMQHRFMETVATGLSQRRIATTPLDVEHAERAAQKLANRVIEHARKADAAGDAAGCHAELDRARDIYAIDQ